MCVCKDPLFFVNTNVCITVNKNIDKIKSSILMATTKTDKKKSQKPASRKDIKKSESIKRLKSSKAIVSKSSAKSGPGSKTRPEAKASAKLAGRTNTNKKPSGLAASKTGSSKSPQKAQASRAASKPTETKKNGKLNASALNRIKETNRKPISAKLIKIKLGDIKDKSKAELLKHARAAGIEGRSKMNREQLIKALSLVK